MTNAPPSVNPANEGHLLGALREVMTKFIMSVDDMLPAKVIAFDRTLNLATVQPLIMMVDTNGQKYSRAQIAAVPVFQIGAGGFVMNFNLNPGDLGFLKANDRDISLFMKSFTEAIPNTSRKHTFQDALFFPSILTGFTIDSEDAGNVVLQTLDGTQRVAIWPDRVKITSDALIVLDAPVVKATGDVIAGDDEISLVHHVHGGVEPGGGTTGEPI